MNDDLQVQLLLLPRIDDPTLPLRPDQELPDPLQRPLRSRQPDPLNARNPRSRWGVGGGVAGPSPLFARRPHPKPDEMVQPLKSQGKMTPSLGLSNRMDLVDDHRFDPGEDLAHVRGEHQV